MNKEFLDAFADEHELIYGFAELFTADVKLDVHKFNPCGYAAMAAEFSAASDEQLGGARNHHLFGMRGTLVVSVAVTFSGNEQTAYAAVYAPHVWANMNLNAIASVDEIPDRVFDDAELNAKFKQLMTVFIACRSEGFDYFKNAKVNDELTSFTTRFVTGPNGTVFAEVRAVDDDLPAFAKRLFVISTSPDVLDDKRAYLSIAREAMSARAQLYPELINAKTTVDLSKLVDGDLYTVEFVNNDHLLVTRRKDVETVHNELDEFTVTTVDGEPVTVGSGSFATAALVFDEDLRWVNYRFTKFSTIVCRRVENFVKTVRLLTDD